MCKCIEQYLSYPSIIKMKIEERDSNWDFPRIIFCLNSLHSLSLSNRMPYKGTLPKTSTDTVIIIMIINEFKILSDFSTTLCR